ncbi:MAG TPA: universal stress protein [Rhodobacteraceae bacterium]|nr:universal stress protein [Paracoccaceae bacterium]
MYKNILIPVALDHNHDVTEALNVARKLMEEGGEITLVSVIEPIPGYIATYMPEGQLEKNRQEILEGLEADAKDMDDVKARVIMGSPGSAIVDHARENGVDLIIIASHKPGLQDYFLGSTAARVVRHAGCAVHVLR